MLEEGGVDLNFGLHPAQQLIYNSPARFKVVAAGRRFGKSYLAAITLLLNGLKDRQVGLSGIEYDLSLKEVYYVAPTFEQGKKILWPILKHLGKDIITSTHENTATLTLLNGRRISIKGSDRPDTLRGVGLSYVVLDEYAFMKEEVWDAILQPALSDVEGDAMFIGTPEGKNHFYSLFVRAQNEGLPIWEAFSFKTVDNPTIAKTEIESASARMSSQLFRQEYEASFAEGAGSVFKADWWKVVENNPLTNGDRYIAIDLAGFSSASGPSKKEVKLKDETAIAVVYAATDGWFIEDIIHGQWDVRETALRIMAAYRQYKPVSLGIEQGALKYAVEPYLEDEMKRLGQYFTPVELKHNSQRKPDRIRWALQGRAEKGRIFLKKSEWNRHFIEQSLDFPSPLSHDDLIDAVAYIDQLASVVYFQTGIEETYWSPLDEMSGI